MRKTIRLRGSGCRYIEDSEGIHGARTPFSTRVDLGLNPNVKVSFQTEFYPFALGL